MDSKKRLDNLVDGVTAALSEFEYRHREMGELDGVLLVARITTSRRMMVRSVCVITHLPAYVTDVPTCQDFFEDIRNCLTKHYALPPWWKELGTYSVILCSNSLFKELSKQIGNFKDRTGFHMNIMLGTCFVDIESFENSETSTWGLVSSGKPISAIQKAIRQWCQECKSEGH